MSKKVFLDTNILIDFFDSKRELLGVAKLSELLARKDKEAQSILVSNIEKITYDPNIEICHFGEMVIRNACSYFMQNGGDYEDILQYFCAEKEGCSAIYSNDLGFPKLKIPIKTYGDFDI